MRLPQTWDIACGTGFATDVEIKRLPKAGDAVTITASVREVLQRQVR
eukprot:COSAG01_NODE_15054_length_1379_cov_2.125000_1_plen_47_part_00